MKVIFFGNCAYTIKIFRLPLFDELKKNGYIVYFWTPSTRLRKYSSGCLKSILSPSNETLSLSSLYSIFHTLLKGNFKIIIANTHIVAIPSIMLAKFTGIKKRVYFLTGFGALYKDNNKLIRKIFRCLIFKIFKLATHVIVQNKIDKRIIEKKIKARVIETIGSGAPEIKNNSLSKKIKNKINVVFAGRLIESKGVNEILQIVKDCDKRNLQINFYIYSMPEYIRRYRKDFNTKNVKFFGFENNVISKLKNMHIAIYLSKYAEGSPRFLIESVMNGLALLVLKNPRSNTIVNENGFIVKNKEELTEKLLIYINNHKILKLHMEKSLKISKAYIDKTIAKKIVKEICA